MSHRLHTSQGLGIFVPLKGFLYYKFIHNQVEMPDISCNNFVRFLKFRRNMRLSCMSKITCYIIHILQDSWTVQEQTKTTKIFHDQLKINNTLQVILQNALKSNILDEEQASPV